jgi:hypothetical protein
MANCAKLRAPSIPHDHVNEEFMELKFRIAVEVPDTEPEQAIVRKLFVQLAAELIRAAARIDGRPKTDGALRAVADVLATIADTETL